MSEARDAKGIRDRHGPERPGWRLYVDPGIDDGQLDGLTLPEVFILGCQYGTVVSDYRNGARGPWMIRDVNRERVVAYLESMMETVTATSQDGGWVEVAVRGAPAAEPERQQHRPRGAR